MGKKKQKMDTFVKHVYIFCLKKIKNVNEKENVTVLTNKINWIYHLIKTLKVGKIIIF